MKTFTFFKLYNMDTKKVFNKHKLLKYAFEVLYNNNQKFKKII